MVHPHRHWVIIVIGNSAHQYDRLFVVTSKMNCLPVVVEFDISEFDDHARVFLANNIVAFRPDPLRVLRGAVVCSKTPAKSISIKLLLLVLNHGLIIRTLCLVFS
jgi:hypothetical protein